MVGSAARTSETTSFSVKSGFRSHICVNFCITEIFKAWLYFSGKRIWSLFFSKKALTVAASAINLLEMPAFLISSLARMLNHFKVHLRNTKK